ncbi:carbohydrate ABC transporter permease [Streptomyces sp. CA-111067]|uniref:carbohydrate ABC transporter permease n=1 Tax=Streptomyces sp. CA-111067 TaxID=3240046 RepID=UPI003D9805B0
MTSTARAAVPPLTTAGRTAAAPSARPGRRRVLTPYLFLTPFYFCYLAFLLVPTAFALWISLHSWTGIGPMQWVGLRNYRALLGDTSFHTAVENTLWYIGASILVIVPLALLIATGLNARGLRGRDTLRLAYFVPMVLSPVIVALIFNIIFDQQAGLLNNVLHAVIGIKPVNWLGDPTWAKAMIVLLLVWRWTGYLVIYFLAGLQSIPRELHEAAALDGAGTVRRFVSVTVPMLTPITAFVAITSFIGAAQVFEEPYILTKGGPGESTLSIANFIYRAAFTREQLGYAAAASFLLFVALFALMRLASAVFGIGREDR